MDGNRLTVDDTEKDLGVWISSDMTCSDQCTYAFNEARRVMGMIKRTIKYKTAMIMVSLYKTLVRPHVEYSVSPWSPYYKKDKELLENGTVGNIYFPIEWLTDGTSWISRYLEQPASTPLKRFGQAKKD